VGSAELGEDVLDCLLVYPVRQGTESKLLIDLFEVLSLEVLDLDL
jgi:hypothetical protein